MENVWVFFSTAGCPSHPWLRGNAFLLFAAPGLYAPQSVPFPAPTELLGPSTISCSCGGLQWTLCLQPCFCRQFVHPVLGTCFRMKESPCRDASFLPLMVNRAHF